MARGRRTGRALIIAAAAFGLPLCGSAQAQPSDDLRQVQPPRESFVPAVPYPSGAEGAPDVLLELTISGDGRVRQARLVRGQEPFASAAIRASETWLFVPARRAGIEVPARIRFQVRFEPPTPPSVMVPTADQGPAEVEVQVQQRAPRPELGGLALPVHEARLIPGAKSDPLKAIEALPSVAPILSGLPYLFVRSSPPASVGYFVDGIRVPALYHIGAGPSVMAAGLVERVDLFASGYPAQVGMFSGAVVSAATRPPSGVASATAMLQAYDAAAFVEQPVLDGKAEVSLGGRYGFPETVLNLVSPDYSLRYSDYQARFSLRLGSSDRLSLFAFGALDRVENQNLPAPLFDAAFQRNELRWDHTGRDGFVRASLVVGAEEIGTLAESGLSQAAPAGAAIERRLLLALLSTEQRLGQAVTLRLGAEGAIEPVALEYDVRANSRYESGPRRDLRGTVYGDISLRPWRELEFAPGVRVDRMYSREAWDTFVEPRGALRIGLSRGVSWVSTAGVANQLPAQATQTPGRTASAEELAKRHSEHASTALELVLPAGFWGKALGFIARTETDFGDTQTRGLELLIRRDFSATFGGLLGYTLSETQVVPPGGGPRVAAPYDRRHLVTGALGIKLDSGLRFGVRGYFESGQPYDFACSAEVCGQGGANLRASGRFPAFARADIDFEKRWQSEDGSWLALNVSWFNAGLASEYDAVAWLPDEQAIALTTRGPLTLPSVGISAGY